VLASRRQGEREAGSRHVGEPVSKRTGDRGTVNLLGLPGAHEHGWIGRISGVVG